MPGNVQKIQMNIYIFTHMHVQCQMEGMIIKRILFVKWKQKLPAETKEKQMSVLT